MKVSKKNKKKVNTKAIVQRNINIGVYDQTLADLMTKKMPFRKVYLSVNNFIRLKTFMYVIPVFTSIPFNYKIRITMCNAFTATVLCC